MGPLGPKDRKKISPPGARRRRENLCELKRRNSWVSPLRIFVIAVLRQSVQRQHARIPRAVDNPGGVALYVFFFALRCLWRIGAARAALDIGNALDGCAERFFLLYAMRAPIGAVKLGVCL